jgi:uncharacterized protein YbjT (DUF2867 family)
MEKAISVLVVGATGYLGMEICRQLTSAHNHQVKGLVRTSSDPSKVSQLHQMGVETITGDMKDPDSLDTAFMDVDVVISTASSTISRSEGDSIEAVDEIGQLNVIDAAIDSGVNQLIYISFPESQHQSPLQDAKRKVEQYLVESGLVYTILRPTVFMEVWLGPVIGFDYPNYKATIFGEGKNKISWIALKDVATFAVLSVANPEAYNTKVNLGGPEGLSPLECVRIFEEQSGRPFQLEFVPEEALHMQKDNSTDALQQSFAALMLMYAEGSEIDMKDTIRKFPVQLTSVREYSRQVVPRKLSASI